MAILNNGRTGLGGGCVGAMKRCIALATKHAVERKQFGRPIAEFDLIREKITRMTVNCFVTESVVSLVAHYIDSGYEDYSIEAAISKVFASEALWETANDALQVAGGNGFMREYPYERIVRDSRINLIFEGTNEILRLFIALSGMKDAGEYLKEIGRSAGAIFNDPIKGFGVLSKYATKKVAQLTPLGHERMRSVHPLLAEPAAIVEQYTVALSHAVEGILREHGKKIIGQQLISKRVANIAIDLFALLAVISRVSALLERGEAAKLTNEVRIVNIFSHDAKRRMNQNLRRLERNEDGDTRALADTIVEQGGYPWDVL
jgi:alkylation response protein AidB-like acyl-CoA dehydrogenase